MSKERATGLKQAFAHLTKQVSVAFSQCGDLPPNAENERERYAAALVSIARFFATLKVPFANRFYELGSAIADLNDGVVHPLLTAVRVDNRPGDPSQLWLTRAFVALALDALMTSGQLEGDAAAYIAREFSSLNILAGTKSKNFAKTIIGWRTSFMSQRIKNWEASEVFVFGKDLIKSLGDRGQHKVLVKFAGDQLAKAARRLSELTPAS